MDDFNIDDILKDIEDDMIIQSKEEKEEVEKIEEENLTFRNEYKKGGNEVSDKIDKSIERSLFKKNNGGLSKNQLVAIELLLKGNTPSQVAKKIGVSRQSIYLWQKNDDFVKMMNKTKKEYISSFQQHIMSKVPLAINTLVDVLQDEYASNKDKISASKTILEMSNVKNGGLKEEDDNIINPNKTQIVLINPMPPSPPKPTQTEEKEKVEEVIDNDNFLDDFNLNEIIDVDVKEKK